jgi:two-component system nitrogen regulation response regulator NtrX
VGDRILVVDDEPDTRSGLEDILTEEGFSVSCAADGEEALATVEADPPHAVFLDIELPGMNGMEVLRRLRAEHPDVSVVMISGYSTTEWAVEATRLGAFDSVDKPCSLDRVLLLARNATADARKNRELARVRAAQVEEMRGESASMKALRDAITRVAPTDARVLILGESGTGKELVARALHRLSPRAEQPFIAVNCAAIPEELVEAEFFGVVRGAFTGAASSREGFFGAADHGTLFLDEIGDMSLSAQSKVLRVLQEGEYKPVGSTRATKVDVRVLAATHQDLPGRVVAGKFREDLLYRLNVIPMPVPPLRERTGDVRLLGRYFLARHAAERKLPVPTLQEASWRLLDVYAWPGNIRELQNVLERLVIFSPGAEIRPLDLRLEMCLGATVPSDSPPGAGWNPYEGTPLPEAMDALERDLIQAALDRHNGNRARAAVELGLVRRHLLRRMKALGMNGEWGNGEPAAINPGHSSDED